MTKTEFFSALKVVGMIGLVMLVIVVGITLLNDKYFFGDKTCTRVETHIVYVNVTPTMSPSPVLLPSGKVSSAPLKATSSAATSTVKQ